MGCNWQVVSALIFLSINRNDNYSKNSQCLCALISERIQDVTLCGTQQADINKYLFAYEIIAASGFL